MDALKQDLICEFHVDNRVYDSTFLHDWDLFAVALDYGYYKATRKEFPEEGSVVLFCDMGKYATTVTVVCFTNVRLVRPSHP